jgi:hypothetical protein
MTIVFVYEDKTPKCSHSLRCFENFEKCDRLYKYMGKRPIFKDYFCLQLP